MSAALGATDELKIELGRRYRFAASHRLHSGQISDAENARIYGKCNNAFGHGHNYVVEVSVSRVQDGADARRDGAGERPQGGGEQVNGVDR